MDHCWEKLEPITNQRTTDVHRRFGTDKSVPYAERNVFSIQLPPTIYDQGGTDKLIRSLRNILTNTN